MTKKELLGLSPEELLAFTSTLTTLDFYRFTQEDVLRIKAFIDSDGCSGVPNFYICACIVHDFWYRTHRNFDGTPITRKEADANFKSYIRKLSWLGWFSLISPMYWIGVRILGSKAWDE